MSTTAWIVLTCLLLALWGVVAGSRTAAARISRSSATPHSQPIYHGLFVAFWMVLPVMVWVVLWSFAAPSVLEGRVIAAIPADALEAYAGSKDFLMGQVRKVAASGQADQPWMAKAADQFMTLNHDLKQSLVVVGALFAALGYWFSVQLLGPHFPARRSIERYVKIGLSLCAFVSVLITAAIVLSVLFESLRFFRLIPFDQFLFGLHWSPQIAMRADQAGSSGAFGVVPLIAGTLLITLIAMLVAVPIGLLSAIYLSEYAARSTRTIAKPMLEILAGIPTVVYGYFAIVTLSPFLGRLGDSLGISVASESALAAGLVMGIMIIPFISSLSDDIITAVPRSLREASLGLGATPSETITHVVVPAALPGIMGAVLLALSRAIGETMIVVMAAGLAANLTANPLEAVTTVTAQIVSLLTGDQEFDSPKTLAAFALGLTLFIITLLLNIAALWVVRKYRERYE